MNADQVRETELRKVDRGSRRGDLDQVRETELRKADRGFTQMNADQVRVTELQKVDGGFARRDADQVQKAGGFSGLNAEVTDAVLQVFYEVYNELGGGFLESVYHSAFAMALRQGGLDVAAEVAVPVYFRGVVVGDFRVDLVVSGCVLLELKAVAALDRVHEAQVLNYLRATKFETALLLNFGPRPQFKRLVLESGNKHIRVDPRLSAVESVGD